MILNIAQHLLLQAKVKLKVAISKVDCFGFFFFPKVIFYVTNCSGENVILIFVLVLDKKRQRLNWNFRK